MQLRCGEVSLRLCESAQHCDIVYSIRNHPTVRANLRDARPIPRASHDAWMRENLVDARRLWLFVVFKGNDPVGIALLRNIRQRSGEIGVMVVDAATRPLCGYKASHLIGYFGFEVLDLEKLYSYVPLHNPRALAFNRRCGFEPEGPPSDIYHRLSLTRERSRSHPTHRHFRAKYGIELMGEIPQVSLPAD